MTRARKGGKATPAEDYQRRLREMNAALLVSATRQHELTERAERAAAAQRTSRKQLRAANAALERRTTALTRQQQRLRKLVKELGRVESRERQRVAGELHDNLAQLLAVCKMRVSAIEASTPSGSRAARDASAVKQLLGQGIDYTRTLMSDLRPDALDAYDLTAAMQWVARRMEKHGLVVRVDDDGDPKPLDEDLLTLVFDSVRELLFNVVKHASKDEATVSLRRVNGALRVSVSDAGVGFDPVRRAAAAPSENGGFGLFSIRERLSLLGGRTEIKSARGRGTRVSLIVPLPSRRDPDPATPGPPSHRQRRRTPPPKRNGT